MNKLFSITILFSFFIFTATQAAEEKGLPRNYEIVKVEEDKELEANEASFLFHFDFIDYNAIPKGLQVPPAALVDQPLEFSYNGKPKKLQTDAKGNYLLTVSPGKYMFFIYHNSTYTEIVTDSIPARAGMRTEINAHFRSSQTRVIALKPVIYLYPEKKTEVQVKLDVKDLSFTYPAYNKGWNCTAKPDGTIQAGDKTVPYLFWEGDIHLRLMQNDLSTGFNVEGKNIVSFLEEKLDQMGLNEKERTDFITYWAPKMAGYKKCFVHFLFNKSFDTYAPLRVDPKPETVWRVFMVWADNTEPKDIAEPAPQEIPFLQRKGFTVVEWGGTQTTIEQFN